MKATREAARAEFKALRNPVGVLCEALGITTADLVGSVKGRAARA